MEIERAVSAVAAAPSMAGSARQRLNDYGVKAYTVVHCPLGEISALRQQLGPPGGKPFPAAFLKSSDEQTVVGVAAVIEAIRRHGLDWNSFADWGVIAAPRFFGRLSCSDSLYRFEVGGAWKAPPLFVAHRSLHAISGTISQALQCRGPNFGVGGGGSAAAEGLLAALTLLQEHRLPGLWLILSECDPEPRPDRQGNNTIPIICHALALAFVPVSQDWRSPRLRLIDSGSERDNRTVLGHTGDPSVAFASLANFFEQGAAGGPLGTWTSSLNWGCELRLTDDA
jgi:hypothetical protein